MAISKATIAGNLLTIANGATATITGYTPKVNDLIVVRSEQSAYTSGTSPYYNVYLTAQGTPSGYFSNTLASYIAINSGGSLPFLVLCYRVLTASDIAAITAAGTFQVSITSSPVSASGTAEVIIFTGWAGVPTIDWSFANNGTNTTVGGFSLTTASTGTSWLGSIVPQYQTAQPNAQTGELVIGAVAMSGTYKATAGTLTASTVNGATLTPLDDTALRTSSWYYALNAPNVSGGNTLAVAWNNATRSYANVVYSFYDYSVNLSGSGSGSLSLQAGLATSSYTAGDLELLASSPTGSGNFSGSASAFVSLLGGGPGPGAVGTQGYTGTAAASISLSAKATPLRYTDYNAVPGRATVPFRPAAPLKGNILTASASISLTAAVAVSGVLAPGAITLTLAGPPATTPATGALVLSGTASPISTGRPASIVLAGFALLQGGHGAITLAATGPAATLPIAADLELLAIAAPYNVAPGSVTLSAVGPSPSAGATGDLELVTHSTAVPLPATLTLTAQPLAGLNGPSTATVTLTGSNPITQSNAAAFIMLTATGPVASASATGDLELVGGVPSSTLNAATVTLNAAIRGSAFVVLPIGTTFAAPARRPAFAAWPAS